MEQLKSILIEFSREVSKIHLLGTVNDELFLEFPSNLPRQVKERWLEKINKIKTPQEANKSIVLDVNEYGFLTSLMEILLPGQKQVDFKQVILRQDLINFLAHLEAVMQDFQRFIFTHKPELLTEEKPIFWKEIADKKSMNEVLDLVIAKQLEKSGYDKLTNQIIRLNSKPFLFKISIDKKELGKLDLLISTRNLILHNGNRITKDYLEKNPSSPLKYGELLKLSRAEVNEAFVLVQRVAYETFASIGNVIFNIPKETLYKDISYNPTR